MQTSSKKRGQGGLTNVKGIWHIDKIIYGKRFCQSCQTGDRQEAERVLARLIEEQRQLKLFGVRPDRTFRQAATYYLEEYAHKRSIARDAQDLVKVDEFIGALPIKDVHNGTLDAFKRARRQEGVKSGTVNRALAVVRRILNLCATDWRDESGLTWLHSAPKISTVTWNDARKPRPITWEEQKRLFGVMPEHIKEACLYKVNTGCREQEVCQLQWDWEVSIPELKTSVFILPDWLNKNGNERVVVLNSVAMAVINRQRGKHPKRVFTYRGKPIEGLNEGAWKRNRKKVELDDVRIHDLRHTTGRRLRAAGVTKETRKDILGHESGDITSHYSIAEIGELLDAVEKIAYEPTESTPSLTLLRLSKSRESPERVKNKGFTL